MAKKPVQQLDMFAAFAEPAPPPKEEVKVEPNVFVELPNVEELNEIVDEVIEEVQQPVAEEILETVEKPTIVFETPASIEETAIEQLEEKTQPIVEEVEEQSPQIVEVIFENEPVIHVVENFKTERSQNTNQPKTKSKRGRKSFKEMDAEVDLIEVPDDEALQKKLYYSISEVAGWFKVNTSLIRAWEKEFDILKPRKNRKGDRLFRAEDVKNLRVIYYLLRNRKFSVDGAKKYLRTNKKSADTNLHLIQSLNKFKGFLLELRANLGS